MWDNEISQKRKEHSMKPPFFPILALSVLCGLITIAPAKAGSEVRAWKGTITLPTYPWEEDVNPRFWALQGDIKLSATEREPIAYPYVMQDHLSQKKVDRTYKALFLENEYLKVTCLPELGGRLHSVLDKTQGKEMFHLNRVIKPGMIALRGAWISGGVEWNTGPHGHTVTVLSPVNACVGRDPDGSAYLEISNLEQIFRTRWTIRVTLRPGRAYLDERIRLENPTDGMHPYYFWNCTALPNRPGTRFIFPMSLGTDHNAKEFFRWPVHNSRDMTWLKNYDMYYSIFAVNCTYDFFGAYDVDADRGVVQWADHNELGGKKAWTWGEWEFGKVAQKNLTDEDGPYIEVQSGPLPTQSDYGMLGPHEAISWREWWYPVHGLGDGFEYATRNVAAQTSRREGRLLVRLLATGEFSQANIVLERKGRRLLDKMLDLSPQTPAMVELTEEPEKPVDITVSGKDGEVLAKFTSPLPVPKVEPPEVDKSAEKTDHQRSVEEVFLKGRKFDRATDRRKAREYYEKALARDPGHVASLRSLAVMDFEAGLYKNAIEKSQKALLRDGDDGLAWFYQGVSQLRLGNFSEALRCGHRAARCPGTRSLGYDLAGRALMRQDDKPGAVAAFRKAVVANPDDRTAEDHLALALCANNQDDESRRIAHRRLEKNPTAVFPRVLLFFVEKEQQFPLKAGSFIGDRNFELLETSLAFAELGLDIVAFQISLECFDLSPSTEKDFLPLYYAAWYEDQIPPSSLRGHWLESAMQDHKDRIFASRPEEVEIFRYAIKENPNDAQAHLQLGCLLAHLGRVDEALPEWKQAATLDPKSSVAWRNLGLAAVLQKKLPGAESLYRKAIAARPNDQTLYRDLAEILIAGKKRPEAIRLLETMPLMGLRRADIALLLAQAYHDEKRYDECVKLLESASNFVNWEGQDTTWRLFNQAHIGRGRERLEKGDAAAALADFEVSITYPTNLNVGRSNKPEEAPAQYWRGKALMALSRAAEARAAWQAGADGADVPGAQNEYRQKCRKALTKEKD
jgi:tetratricopeptide (TPR) repeat protein